MLPNFLNSLAFQSSYFEHRLRKVIPEMHPSCPLNLTSTLIVFAMTCVEDVIIFATLLTLLTYFTTLLILVWAHQSGFTPPLFIEVPVQRQVSDRFMYLCAKGILVASFYLFSIGFCYRGNSFNICFFLSIKYV